MNGNVQYVTSLLGPIVSTHEGTPTLVRRVKALLEAAFTGVTVATTEDPVYEIRWNPEGHPCTVCTAKASFHVPRGADTVVVDVRESVHYTL